MKTEKEKTLLELAQKGDVCAMKELGDLYYFPICDFESSLNWYKKALENGDKDVLFDIAKVYEQLDIQNAAKNMPEGDELIEYELSDITLEWYEKALSNYENNYNEKLEKEIDEIMKPLIENGTGYDYQFLFNQLNERYEQTNYPGFIYTIGFLYQRKILKSDNSKEHMIYYQRAAEQNYLYALLRLNETFLNDIDFELSMNNRWYSQPNNYKMLYNDPYGKYLLAKFNMLKCINDNEMDESFMGALCLMKESANSGCEDAIRFMQAINIDGINKIIQD